MCVSLPRNRSGTGARSSSECQRRSSFGSTAIPRAPQIPIIAKGFAAVPYQPGRTGSVSSTSELIRTSEIASTIRSERAVVRTKVRPMPVSASTIMVRINSPARAGR